MAATIFNTAKGRIQEFHNNVNGNDPTNSALIVVLMKASETHAVLQDYDDLSTLLAAGGNTECDFTNYARKTITDADIGAATIDDTNNRVDLDITANPTWTSAGGTTDNNILRIVLCYDPDTTGGTDANLIPIAVYDANTTTPGDGIDTNGSDLSWAINASGYARAS